MTIPSPAALEQRLREALVEKFSAEGFAMPIWGSDSRRDYSHTCADVFLPFILRALDRAGLVLAEGRGE